MTTTMPPSSTKHLRRYLIARHGETNFNKERRVQGTSDASVLTLDGISQAAALGMYLARRQAGIVIDNDSDENDDGDHSGDGCNKNAAAPAIIQTWCSPLTRCRQTYAAISGCCSSKQNDNDNHHPLPNPTIHTDLREIELCEWQNRLRQEIIDEDSYNWNVFKRDPKMLRLNNGKFAPVLDCWDRGLKNWNAIRSNNAASLVERKKSNNNEEVGAIFIMCHGAIGQCMLLQALGIDIDMYGKSRRYAFDNCECIEIEWADEDECSVRWRRAHAPDMESSKKFKWQSTSASRMASGGLSCSR
mmetsp:Transcript_10660/g.23564  ORF Transcript_10660/g.23564 Transcript_10660/m.23564 type:complete len:302 (-) Transcript_10660:137-1042(-)